MRRGDFLFAFADEHEVDRQQLAGLQFGADLRFEYRAVQAGPANYSSHHDFALADVSIFEAGCRAEDEGFAAVCIDTMSDSGVAALRWRNGAMGTLNVTMLTYPKNLEGSITLLGERGSVRIGGVAVNEIQHWQFDAEHPMDAQVRDASYQTTSVYGFGHPLYYDNVIRTLRGECEPETDGREGLKSLELLIAMYRSARDGKRINLPLAY